MSGEHTFRCPECGYRGYEFRRVCPGCGRRFVQNSTDTKKNPGNSDFPDAGMSRLWMWVFFLVTTGGVVLGLILNFGLLGRTV
jgi:DNA-directed RNA polymerase subunit RPC12/RpoP